MRAPYPSRNMNNLPNASQETKGRAESPKRTLKPWIGKGAVPSVSGSGPTFPSGVSFSLLHHCEIKVGSKHVI